MFDQLYKKFTDQTLTDKDFIVENISEMGAGLYSYMLMLDHTDRKKEAGLIEDLRTTIFSARTSYKEDQIDKIELSVVFRHVRDLLNVQLVMISSNPVTSWERMLFQSYTNSLNNFIWNLNPNHDPV